MSALDFLARLIVGPQPATPAQVDSGWYPMPGGRLELRDTGFAIVRCTHVARPPFELIDPDGRVLANGYVLQPLKQFAEQGAADRAEFRA